MSVLHDLDEYLILWVKRVLVILGFILMIVFL